MLQSMAAITAAIGGVIVVPMTAKSENPIGYEKNIPPMILHRNTEHQIENHAHCAKTNEVGYGIYVWLTTKIVDDSTCNNKDEPYARQEKHDGVGLSKRVKSWMKEILLPGLRIECLNRAIYCCRDAHRKTKESGVEAANVVKMNDKKPLFAESLNDEQQGRPHEGGKEEEKAVVTELRDEAGDEVVGDSFVKKLALAHPSHRYLIASHHHPYAIEVVPRNVGHVRHNNFVVAGKHGAVASEDGACHTWDMRGEGHAIGSDKVIVFPIMVRSPEIFSIDVRSSPWIDTLRFFVDA